MYSFGFPDMIRSNTSVMLKDKEAIRSNLRLILASEQNSHFGDPYFGAALKRAFFEQSNSIIVDLMIDELYTVIKTFIPQVLVTGNMITLTTDGIDIFAEIRYIFVLDNTSDLYVINLTKNDDI